jgi:hypothetical protein
MRFQGKLARPRQLDKFQRAMTWIRKFVYTDRATIEILLDVSPSVACNFLAQLRDEKKIVRTVGHNIISPVYRLSPAGAKSIDRFRDEYDLGLKAATSADESGTSLAGHNLMVQRLAATMWRANDYVGHVLSPRQIRLHGMQIGTSSEEKAAWKWPDAMYVRPTTEVEKDMFASIEFRSALEVQQSPEVFDARAHKLWQYLIALESGQIQDFLYCSSYRPIISSFLEQWRTDLTERVYDGPRHRWKKPENPRVIDPNSPILERGRFMLLDHDPFAVGLYPAPHLVEDGAE